MYNVSFYFDKNNKSEIIDLLEELKSSKSKDVRIKRNKILAYIKLLKQYGALVGEPICKHLDGELYELRPVDNRILFFYHEKDQYILLTHFVKKKLIRRQKVKLKEQNPK